MVHIPDYNQFLLEAYANIDTSNFDKILITNKNKILASIKLGDYNHTLDLLNSLFKNKIKQVDKSAEDIDVLITKIKNEIQLINKKILKYPKIKLYLKDEITEQNQYINYLKNKNRKFILLKFDSYENIYGKKTVFNKFLGWIKKNIFGQKIEYNLNYNEYKKKEDGKEEVISHDLGLSDAAYFPFDNYILFVFREDFVKKVNENNFNLFVNLLKVTYRHEMTHLTDYLTKALETMKDDNGLVPYLEQGSEKLAYAETIVDELRLNKFTDKQIEDIIIEPHKNEIKVKASESLNTYYKLYFNTNRYIYYRIVSECLDIINKIYK